MAMEEAPLRILLIEDEDDHVAMIRRAFDKDREAVELWIARSLHEARRHLAQSIPDLLIADLCLRDGKSTEILGNLIPGLPAVIITSHGEEFTAVEAAEFGAIDYVIKSPEVFSNLPRIARRAIRRWSEASHRWWPQIHYRQFLEREQDIIFTLDREGYVTFSNPAAEAILGYPPEELLGKHFETFVAAEYRKQAKADFDALLKKRGELSAESVFLDKSGQEHHVEYSVTVLEQNGKPVGVSGIVRDVTLRKRAEAELARYRDQLEELVAERTAELARTNEQLKTEIAERHRAEKELHESHERFLAVLNSLDAAVYVADMETYELLFMNKFTGCVMGNSQEQICWKVLQRSQTGPCPFCTNSRLLGKNGKPTGVYIWEFQNTRNGRWYECHDQAVPWIDGRLVRLEIAIDITQRKQAEQTLNQERKLLREMVDLQEQERRLVSYEIHDGLAQQVAGALLQFQAYEQLNDPMNAHARRAFARGLHLLSESVQEARRLISGLRPPILDESGIVAAIEYLVCEHEQHGDWNIDFTHDIVEERLAPLLETSMFRIAQEGLANACKHSGSETIRVHVATRPTHVIITVEDWGVGFDPGRVASSRFGLQGIRERARLLGGRAVIDSTLGEGTRILVELPLVERAVFSG